jgi:hypothetical protein
MPKSMKPDFESRAFIRRGNTLVPADVHAEDLFEGIKDGKKVLIRIWSPRNIDHHRKLFAILNCVCENSEKWNDVEELLQVVKIATGYVTVVQGLDGDIYRIPKSISFASMPQDQFNRFFNRAVYTLSQISGISEDVLLEESKI